MKMFMQMFGSLVLGSLGSFALAQDVVVATSATNPRAQIKRTGEILDYTGSGVRLKSSLGREETIPAARIVEIQTRWTAAHEKARAAQTAGKLSEAIAGYQEAKAIEPRLWAVRQIMADLAGAYLEAGRIDEAGEDFLAIVAQDAATPHFEVAPIAWRTMPLSLAAQSRAAQWLQDKGRPAARLLGASWLLTSDHAAEAQAALDELTRSPDPRIAAIATSQLWRTKSSTATPSHVALWQAELEKQPLQCQAAGWYVLGDLAAGLDEPSQAAICYLKVPILFRRQRLVSAEALLAAAEQLEKAERQGQARGLYSELIREFGHLPAAELARRRFEAMPEG
jgi:tetratricopeptide (TPR) repeat protein